MSDSPQANVTISPAHFRDQLIAKVAAHMADLTQALQALQDGSFIDQAKRNPLGVIRIEYPNVDIKTGAEQRQIKKCFHNVVGAFITFLDQIIGVQRFVAEKAIPVERSLTEADILPYVTERLENCIAAVSSDRSLTNPKKIRSFFGISEWAKQVSDGLFSLRRCYEHHDGMSRNQFVVPYRKMLIVSGEEEIVQLPHRVKVGGSLGLKFVDKAITVQKGDHPELTEEQLRDIVSTIELQLSLEILQLVSAGMSQGKT
jgi:hypothetical protein